MRKAITSIQVSELNMSNSYWVESTMKLKRAVLHGLIELDLIMDWGF